jgi:hypothetical protein
MTRLELQNSDATSISSHQPSHFPTDGLRAASASSTIPQGPGAAKASFYIIGPPPNTAKPTHGVSRPPPQLLVTSPSTQFSVLGGIGSDNRLEVEQAQTLRSDFEAPGARLLHSARSFQPTPSPCDVPGSSFLQVSKHHHSTADMKSSASSHPDLQLAANLDVPTSRTLSSSATSDGTLGPFDSLSQRSDGARPESKNKVWNPFEDKSTAGLHSPWLWGSSKDAKRHREERDMLFRERARIESLNKKKSAEQETTTGYRTTGPRDKAAEVKSVFSKPAPGGIANQSATRAPAPDAVIDIHEFLRTTAPPDLPTSPTGRDPMTRSESLIHPPGGPARQPARFPRLNNLLSRAARSLRPPTEPTGGLEEGAKETADKKGLWMFRRDRKDGGNEGFR